MRLIADTHTHTLASNHAYSTVMENIVAAREQGLLYMAMTEHGPKMPDAPHIWHCVNQWEVPSLYKGLNILHGIEVDVMDEDGTLDIDNRVLAGLEWVIASMHGPCFAPATEQEHTGDEYSQVNEVAVHRAIKKVSEDIEAMKFNTAIATLMALVNDFYANGASRGDMKALLLMLSPFAPHMCEELWEMAGYGGQVSQQSWPVYDESKTVTATTQMAVQVSGKVKANIVVPTDASDEEIVKTALAEPKIVKLAEDKELVKSVVVKGRLVSLIFKPKA